ncbi:DeoR family transcriptional regulator [Paenibacillus baekrokdamisoli]|uniref:DeoR family transcriptional regulator n=1 Tax=Paenibacillus baekrokdamisoli TaxID=1712516 RepID=A0A3G9J5E8_9BACL|nr:YafY family protein [Paenibacillus baekrokdamisoli]MBB3068763.1 putative DNA-binding transcriptional regulator YafY [Paenibacillus baekrokdamisoli]BBH23595.1 DeoR family transcriptional regulator [Paenibacillus baekrokdamisoli]
MKIDRLLAMTVLLLNRKRVSAKELADRFEVSTKTIYRDMETLNQAGIPIVAHQGILGGFEIMEPYTIARQFLTLNEITAIIAAVKGIATAVDDSMLTNLLDKVQAMLSKMDRIDAEQQGTGMVFDFNPWGQSAAAREKVNTWRQAIEETRKVKIQYLNMNGVESERVVEPAALIMKGNLWYLHAYCNLRQDFRVFRLSRVQDLQMLTEHFERRPAPSLDGYAWDSEWSKDSKREVILTFHPKVRYRVVDSFPPDWVTELEDGSVQVKGELLEDEWLYGTLLSYGDKVKVEQPTSVVEEVVSRAQKIIERYSNEDR